MLQCVAVCCSVLQCVAVCCSVLQCVAMAHVPCIKVEVGGAGLCQRHHVANELQCESYSVCCNVLQCACCSVLQCVAVAYIPCIKVGVVGLCPCMGWLQLVGSLKLIVSFAEYSLYFVGLFCKRVL